MYPNYVIFKNRNTLIFVFLLLLIPFLLIAQTSSEKLSTKVESALSNYYPQEFNISVENNGKVKIEGQVNSLFDKLRIYEIISQVPGVKYIEDNLAVNTPVVPDDVIKQNIESQLEKIPAILEPNRIQIKVDNGLVFLTGDVSYYREKELAESVSSWQQGVTGIVNEIKVLPQAKAVSDSNLKTVINEILKNRFSLDTGVSFTVINGVVTLDGTAYSMWDKIELGKEISRIIGVKSVVNNLKIKGTEIG
jgi:osmotically-inducible protein OsmY